jgi:TonB-linked SusC/RagA family outer membrane protein
MKKPVVKQRLLFRIMKITLFQLVLAFVFSSVTMANSVKGQKKLNNKITFTVVNLSLDKVLSKLQKSANVNFSYNSKITHLNERISIDANDETLSSILSQILKPFNISYSEESNQIILHKHNEPLNGFAAATDQNSLLENLAIINIIKGKVIDEKGNALPGATVQIKGSTITTMTDANGDFTIDVPISSSKLIISYVGMETQEVIIKSKKITIVLSEIGQALKEVVITTGYEKTSKRTFTGATSKISEKELKVEGVVDVSRMIEGKAAGVTVQNVTGSFGAAPKITVRGSSSIFGDTKPLWVIDGIVQEDIVNITAADLASGNSETLLSSAVAGLNANDILSIEILKDASATSIYGSRSMNGVVVVTTKQGRKESPLNVTYSLEQTLRTVPNYNQYDILNSKENMSILKEIESKGFLELPNIANQRNGGIYNILANATNTYNQSGTFDAINKEHLTNKFLQKYELANTNWFDVLFRPSITQNHSLSFSGGGKNSTYYASLGYYNDPGWTLADNVKRITSNIKSTFYLNDKLNITVSTLASVRNQGAPGSYDSKKDEVYGGTNRDFDINPFNYVLNTSRTLRPYDNNGNLEYYRNNWAPFNILNELENNSMEINVKDISFQANLDYKITPSLAYNITASNRYANTVREHNILENSNIVAAHNAMDNTLVRDDNSFLYQDLENPTAPKVSVLENGGIKRKFTNEMTSYNIRNSISYKKTIADQHELDVFFGTEIRSVDRSSDNFTAFGLQFDRGLVAFTDPRILEKQIREGNSYFELKKERERTVGIFGKAAYTYDRRYTGSLTGRYDGSNRQGRSGSNSWLPTYTISGKWNLSEENFMKNINQISKLSLRASYGLTATAGPATNSFAIYKSSITNRLNVKDREGNLYIDDLQNSELTWEKQFETNVGMDLGLFNNRVQLTTDVYSRKAFDLIDYVVTSGIGGQKIKQGNNANMETKGIEVALTTQNLGTSQLKWSTTLNFSIFNQEVTKIANQPTVLKLVDGTGNNTLGHPRNALYSYQFTGLNNQGLPTFVMPKSETDNVSGANFQDSENISNYLKYEGSIEPNKSAGLSNTFTYKNWSLNVFVVASGGNKVRLNPIYDDNYSDLTVFTKDFTNRWINPGDEAYTNIPVIADRRMIQNYQDESKSLAIAYNTYNYSDVRVADGTFVRLKNVSITYEFPKDLKKKLGLTTFNLKGVSTNPLLIYSDKKLNGQDPEFSRSGGVSMPITTQYSFAINLSL